MKINGAWYTEQLPSKIVVELENGRLNLISVSPFRFIGGADLKIYKGYHPRQMKGQPMPVYLDRFYGFERLTKE